MLRYLPLVWRNCFRNRRRTVLTVASLSVSMCLLGVIIAMYHAFYLSPPTTAQARRLAVRNRISITAPMPNAYQSRIRSQPGVREVMMAKWFGGVYKDSRDARNQFARFLVEPEKLFTIYGEWRIPEEQKRAFERDRTGSVIGRDLANSLGFKVGNHIHLTGDLFPGDFEVTVSGIFDSPNASNVMYFNKEYVEQSLPARRHGSVGTGTVFWVLLEDPESATRVASAIDADFRNSTAQTKTEPEQAFLVGFLSVLGNVKIFLLGISLALGFTILLVSANTLAMSVRERKREIAILKSLGFPPAIILGLVLAEALTLAILGGAVGYGISTGILHAMIKSPFANYLPPIPVFEPVTAAACMLAAATIGLASSLVPALGAARTPILNAMRSAD